MLQTHCPCLCSKSCSTLYESRHVVSHVARAARRSMSRDNMMSVPRCRGLRWPPSSKSCSTLYESRRQSTPGSDRAVPGSKSRSTLYESRLSMRSSLRRLARKPVASCSTLYESRHPASRTKAPAGIRSKSCSTLYESRPRQRAPGASASDNNDPDADAKIQRVARAARRSTSRDGWATLDIIDALLSSKSCSTLYESRQGYRRRRWSLPGSRKRDSW